MEEVSLRAGKVVQKTSETAVTAGGMRAEPGTLQECLGFSSVLSEIT